MDAALSARIQSAGRARLVPRRLGLVWQVVIPASVLGYLGWALAFTARLLSR